jgi:hypothetical protein
VPETGGTSADVEGELSDTPAQPRRFSSVAVTALAHQTCLVAPFCLLHQALQPHPASSTHGQVAQCCTWGDAGSAKLPVLNAAGMPLTVIMVRLSDENVACSEQALRV